MKKFYLIDTLIGWSLFIVATIIYTLTVEPTASFWDCSEYIAAAYKLQVTHAPGAPLFLLLVRMFSFLANHDTAQIAFWMNMSSVLASAGSVMVVFWIISLLGRKALRQSALTLRPVEAIVVWGAGVVGALALTFCGTFWFISTETETYASATLVVCLAIWAMLNWELAQDAKRAYRWLIFIAYLLGLSLGLRVFSLLTLPGLCLIFYFRKNNRTTVKGIILTLFISSLMIMVIYVGIMTELPRLAMQLELLCVNRLGLPYQSGIVGCVLIVLGSLVYGLIYTTRHHYERLNVALLGLTFILIGYSSYTLVLIRANANPPINQNNPSNIISLINYLKRDQYGHRPLLYGPNFASRAIGVKKGSPVYIKTTDQYQCITHKQDIIFDPKSYTLLPRLWSSAEPHIVAYRNLLQLKPGQLPHFGHNLKFLFQHQLGYFYLRYFLWNFAGRASDIQGASWLTPVDVLKKVPPSIVKNSGRANYLLLPLLLGLCGIFFQYNRDVKSLFVFLTLFFMLGAALVLFLNPPPIEPRERDYIYVGSFLIFTIWIGLGTLGIIDYLQNIIHRSRLAIVLGITISMSVPAVMAIQGWHSYDRSHRYFSVDSAKNLLASCAPNAILFTAGDNDTFPLWYTQEVEGFRTDVRVIVLTYANTAWYLNQMMRQVYQSAPLPLSISQQQYRQYGLNDFLPYIPQAGIKGPVDLQQYLQLIQQAHPALQIRTYTGEYTNTLPAQAIRLGVNKKAVIEKGIIPPALQYRLDDQMVYTLKNKGLEKKDLMILDLIATNNWERPIYFTSLQSLNIDLRGYTIAEGMALRLLPIKSTDSELVVNTAVMYDNLMHQFYWRGLDNPRVYYDENYRGIITNHRLAFCTLAQAFLKTREKKQAREVLLHCLAIMPDQAIPYDGANATMIKLLFEVSEVEKALEIAHMMGKRAQEILAYKAETGMIVTQDTKNQLAILHEIGQALANTEYKDLAEEYQELFYQYYSMIDLRYHNQ